MFGFKRRSKERNKFFKFQEWLGYDRIVSSSQGLATNIKGLFVLRKGRYKEDFSGAVARLGLSEAELLQRQKGLLRLVWIMLSMALCAFIYFFFLLWNHHFAASIIALVMTMVALTLAFRYHFWYYQMKVKRLGCSFNEWLNALITRSSS